MCIRDRFLPTTGVINHLSFPSNARVDTGVSVKDEIKEFYDPLIAKIIVHSLNRDSAIKEINEALLKLEISSLITNVNFLISLINHKAFFNINFDTQLIERELQIFSKDIEDYDEVKVLAAIASLDLSAPQKSEIGFTLWEPLKREVRLDVGIFKVTITDFNNFLVEYDNKEYLVKRDGWRINNKITNARLVKLEKQVSIFYMGSWNFSLIDNLNPGIDEKGTEDKIIAPMPGIVKAINVTKGDKIKEGDALIIQEAMKMEHTLCSEIEGTVKSVNVRVGDQVEAGTLFINIDGLNKKDS